MAHRTRNVLLTAAAVAVLAPMAVIATPASAIDQDLQVSATNGPPGTQITVTSASCVSDDDVFRVLDVRFISGTAPNEVMAGAASGYEDQDAVITVPDWIDPTEPAVIEASCLEIEFEVIDDPEQVTTPFDPVPFDVEAGIDPPVQERTFSRTSLLAGQAFGVKGTGCFLPNAVYFGIDVVTGDDLSGRSPLELVGSGGGDVDGTDVEGAALMSNAGWEIGITQTDDEPPVFSELNEHPTDIPAGTYTAIVYCGDDLGNLLLFQPELIEITGDAPFADIDLTVPAETRDASLAGGSCTQGDVFATLESVSSDAFLRNGDPATELSVGTRAPRFGVDRAPADGDTISSRASDRFAASSRRALADDGYVEAEVTPSAEGDWSVDDSVDFDSGVVIGTASCGDALEDGFVYDQQLAAVAVSPEEETTTTTAPAPVPADVIEGSPNYAG